MVWDAARGFTIAWGALLIIQGILPAATVYLSRGLVNALAGRELHTTVTLAAAIGSVLLLTELLRGAIGWIRTVQSELVQDHIYSLIHEKSVAVDLAFYDLPEYYDHLHRARGDASYRPVELLENMGSVLANGITLAAMVGILAPYGLWLPLALLAGTLPALYVVVRYTQIRHAFRQRTTADERRTWYYDWLLTGQESAAELRLFDLGRAFRIAFQELRAGLRGQRMRMAREQALAQLIAAAAALVVAGGAMVWIGLRALRGQATLGDLALFYQAFSQGQGLMRTLLEGIGQIYTNSLFLGDLFKFLALEPSVADPVHPVRLPFFIRKGIRFDNVSFQYPGSSRFALSDFNLHLPAGRITAIVGANGAGKSTLIKLICRFYDPVEGSVSLDGIDLREVKVEELRKAVTVLFQDPVHYNSTVAENIALAQRASLEEIHEAAAAAGAVAPIMGLKQGYDTLLGKWFENGEEMSVGEWQRIALARAFLRKSPVLLLDEPTSAMDSWAEADWVERLRENARGRTVMMITHRFTTAMWADNIHVMMDGRIVESGTHAQLIEMNGLYSESWEKQVPGFRLRVEDARGR